MGARNKLNSPYTLGAILLAGFVGAFFNPWWAFGVALAVVVGLHVQAGNIRWAWASR